MDIITEIAFEDKEKYNIGNINSFLNKIKNIDLKPFDKFYWYYKKDEKFCKEEGFDPKEQDFYSGIIIPIADSTRSGFEYIEDGIVVVTDYPTDKCEPEYHYISFKRLVDNDDLVEIYTHESLEIKAQVMN